MNPQQTLAAFLGITLIVLSVREFWGPEVHSLLGGAGSANTPAPPDKHVTPGINSPDSTLYDGKQ